MSKDAGTGVQTRTEGAVKGGEGRFIFPLAQMAGIEAGTGYSTAHGPVVEGERMQCALVTKARGTGSRPHLHPNEQWNYIVKGNLRVKVGEGGKLFGSITSKDIADALERRGITVDKNKVDLEEPLKMLGTYKVAIKVYPGLTPEVTVDVEPKG